MMLAGDGSRELHHLQRPIRFCRQLGDNRVAGPHFAARENDTHHSRPPHDRAGRVAGGNLGEQAGLKAIDLHAWVAKAGQLEKRALPDSQASSRRQL